MAVETLVGVFPQVTKFLPLKAILQKPNPYCFDIKNFPGWQNALAIAGFSLASMSKDYSK